MGENMAATAKKTEDLSQFGQTVIEGKNVTKVFGETVTALEGANFDIRAGEFISLVGPSGCGKSTLLRLVAGLIEKTSGDVKVNEDLVKIKFANIINIINDKEIVIINYFGSLKEFFKLEKTCDFSKEINPAISPTPINIL